MVPLRRLTLSMLNTSWSTSYQTTCTVSKRSSIKGTCQCKPTWSSSFALWHGGSLDTALKEENSHGVLQCQLSERPVSSRFLFRPPAAPAHGKGLGPDQCRWALGSCRHNVLSEGKAARNTAPNDHQGVQQSQVTLWHHMETREASLREREKALPNIRPVTFKLFRKV